MNTNMKNEKLNNEIRAYIQKALKSLAEVDFESALESLKAAEVLDNDNPEVLYNLGAIYSRQGLHKTAIEYYRKVLNLSFAFVDVLVVKKMLIYSLVMSENIPEALKLLKEQLERDAEDTLLLSMLGYAYEQLKKYSEAVSIYRRIISIDKENINAYNSLGYLMAYSDLDLNKSLHYARIAYNQDSENPAYLDTMGFVYLKRGELGLAKKFLKKALEKSPGSMEIREHLNQLLQL